MEVVPVFPSTVLGSREAVAVATSTAERGQTPCLETDKMKKQVCYINEKKKLMLNLSHFHFHIHLNSEENGLFKWKPKNMAVAF